MHKRYHSDPQFRERTKKEAKKWVQNNRKKRNLYFRSYQKIWRKSRPLWAELLYEAKHRAKLKGIPFTLDNNWALKRWTGKCELSDLAFFSNKGKKTGGLFSPSIDRINPRNGYTKRNCRFVLLSINKMKSNGKDSDIVMIARAIISARTN